MRDEIGMAVCARCGAELEPGAVHDADLCATLARFRATAQRHPNFGKPAHFPTKERRNKPAAPALNAANARERRPAGIERSQPPERDYGETVADPREFHSRVDVSGSIQILLEHLRQHFGQWFPMVELQRLMKVEMVHSRVAEARELIQEDEDIDQESRLYEPTGKLHSFYRLCLKAESHRLQRLAERGKDEKVEGVSGVNQKVNL